MPPMTNAQITHCHSIIITHGEKWERNWAILASPSLNRTMCRCQYYRLSTPTLSSVKWSLSTVHSVRQSTTRVPDGRF